MQPGGKACNKRDDPISNLSHHAYDQSHSVQSIENQLSRSAAQKEYSEITKQDTRRGESAPAAFKRAQKSHK